MHGSIAKELKGSIFTPKIVDGPRVRRSTAVVNQQPPPVKSTQTAPQKAKKAAEPKTAKPSTVTGENKVNEKKETKPVEKAAKKETKPKQPTATKTKPLKPTEPLMDSIDDEDEEDDDLQFSNGKSAASRPAVLPSVIAMELEAINAIKPKQSQSQPAIVSPPKPVKVVPVVHELPKPTVAVQPPPTVPVPSPSDIPVLVDVPQYAVL